MMPVRNTDLRSTHNLHRLKKSIAPPPGKSTYEYELSNHLNTFYISFAPVCDLQTGAFCVFQNFFEKLFYSVWQICGASVEGSRKGINNPPPGTKEGENMDYPNRLEWQIRCASNAYCKRTLRNELIDTCRESKSQQKHEVNFSDLAPFEEKQLYTVDRSAKSNICHFINQKEE